MSKLGLVREQLYITVLNSWARLQSVLQITLLKHCILFSSPMCYGLACHGNQNITKERLFQLVGNSDHDKPSDHDKSFCVRMQVSLQFHFGWKQYRGFFPRCFVPHGVSEWHSIWGKVNIMFFSRCTPNMFQPLLNLTNSLLDSLNSSIVMMSNAENQLKSSTKENPIMQMKSL